MKLVKQNAEFLPITFNKNSIEVIEKAGAICYKTENPSENFIQKRIKAGHTSILEHGNIIMVVNDRMFKFMRAFIIHSTEFMYIKLSIRHKDHNIISGNCRSWYNLLLKNTQLDKKKGYSTFICLLATRLKVNFPEIFEQLFIDKKYTELQELKGFSLKLIERIDELNKPEFFTHIRLNAFVISERIISQQWFRHRHLSPSQESTRYCNYGKSKFDSEITFIDSSDYFKTKYDWITALETYKFQEISYLSLIKNNKPEVARSVLGNGLKSEYYVTGYGSDWDDFFRQRLSKDVDPQIKDLAIQLFQTFAKIVS